MNRGGRNPAAGWGASPSAVRRRSDLESRGARSRARRVDARKIVLDLDDVVFEEVARHRGSDRTIDGAGVSAGRVLGDRKQLARLTGNLLENALRHARNRVAVSLSQDNEWVVLRVDDDGTGLPPRNGGASSRGRSTAAGQGP
ncbi:MAG: hypothetical protein GEU68_08535 [Actinobacteria bacterium]|nr:hypothetical protein [Actinomycetota bacterium]